MVKGTGGVKGVTGTVTAATGAVKGAAGVGTAVTGVDVQGVDRGRHNRHWCGEGRRRARHSVTALPRVCSVKKTSCPRDARYGRGIKVYATIEVKVYRFLAIEVLRYTLR